MSVKLLVPVRFECDLAPYCKCTELGTCACNLDPDGFQLVSAPHDEPKLPPGWGYVKHSGALYCPDHFKEYGP